MKKCYLLPLVLLVCTLTGTAQNSKDSVLNMITKEVCKEIGKKNLTGKTAGELQMELGLMTVPSITSRMEVLKKYYGMESIPKDDLGQVANNIRVMPEVDCSNFMILMPNNPALMTAADNEKSTSLTISGTLQRYYPAILHNFLVKDAIGKVQKKWWMEYFESADKLTDQMQKKPVTVTYNIKAMDVQRTVERIHWLKSSY